MTGDNDFIDFCRGQEEIHRPILVLCEERRLPRSAGSLQSLPVPDAAAAERHFVRVIDESGEDYLYAEAFFVPVELPRAAMKVLASVS